MVHTTFNRSIVLNFIWPKNRHIQQNKHKLNTSDHKTTTKTFYMQRWKTSELDSNHALSIIKTIQMYVLSELCILYT